MVLSLVAAFLMISVDTVTAHSGCSCVTRTPQQHVNEAAAVFSATVTDVRVDEPILGGGSVTATFRTDHVYKGDPGAEPEVFTKAQGSACGYPFTKGAVRRRARTRRRLDRPRDDRRGRGGDRPDGHRLGTQEGSGSKMNDPPEHTFSYLFG